jgi:hypothetical protein
MDAYRCTYREIDDLMARLVPLLAPLSPPA